MGSIVYVVPVLLVIAVSVFIVKIATIALKMTGLEEKKLIFRPYLHLRAPDLLQRILNLSLKTTPVEKL